MPETRGEITLPMDEARKVFDTAINSMDFGSGFLDNDEVEALRKFAVRIGINPMHATPSNFWSQYIADHQHEFVSGKRWNYTTRVYEATAAKRCLWCAETRDG